MAVEQQPVIENPSTDQNVVGSVTTADGFTVDSNFETPEQLKRSLGLDGDEAPAAVEAPAPKRRNRRDDPRVAVESAVGKQREAERLAAESSARVTALEAELAELRKAPPVAAPVPPPPVRPAPVAAAPPAAAPPAPPTQAEYKRYMAMPDVPKVDQFPGENGWQEYQFAVSQFIADKRFDERMAQHAHAQQVAQQQTKFQTRIQAEVAKDATFQQKLDSTPVDTRIIPYLHGHPQGDEIMVHLVTHPEIAQHLTTLHPLAQIGQIGEIVGTLKAQSAAASSPASARPAISQAKPPTKRVVGAPPAATDDPPDENASEEAHEAFWGSRRQDFRQHRRRR